MRFSGGQTRGGRGADGRGRADGNRRVDGRGRAGRHRRGGTDAGPLIARRDHTPARPRRGLPAPSPSALVGLAVLVLIAVGAIHLSGSGTAVPLEDPPGEAVSAPGPEGTDSADEGAEAATAGERAEVGTRGSDVMSGSGGTGTADGTAGADSAAAADGTGAADGTTPGEDGAPAQLVVHVSGAVASPGVVRLPAGARVDDALRAAGGADEDADLAAVNLARPVADGEQIHVPRPGEAPRAAPAAPGPDEAASGTGSPAGGGLVDLNTADAAALEDLPGVGPAIAQRIIEHREKNGPFTSVDDLLEVSGIGPATLEGLREQATV